MNKKALTGIAGIVVAAGIATSGPALAGPICDRELAHVMDEIIKNEKRGIFNEGVYKFRIEVNWTHKLSQDKIKCLKFHVTQNTNGEYEFAKKNVYGTPTYYVDRLKNR